MKTYYGYKCWPCFSSDFRDKCPKNPKPKNISWVKYTLLCQGWKIISSYKFSNFIPSSHFRNVVMQGCKIIWENYIFCWLYHWICSIYQCLHSSNIFKLTQRLHLKCKYFVQTTDYIVQTSSEHSIIGSLPQTFETFA